MATTHLLAVTRLGSCLANQGIIALTSCPSGGAWWRCLRYSLWRQHGIDFRGLHHHSQRCCHGVRAGSSVFRAAPARPCLCFDGLRAACRLVLASETWVGCPACSSWAGHRLTTVAFDRCDRVPSATYIPSGAECVTSPASHMSLAGIPCTWLSSRGWARAPTVGKALCVGAWG